MLVALGEIHYLRHFRFGNLVTEDTHNGDAFLVDRQHQFKRLRMGQPKKPLQNMDNELHRSEIIVQDQYLVHRGAFCLGLGFKGNTDVAFAIAFFLGHHVKLCLHFACLVGLALYIRHPVAMKTP